jgi:hypothetical protein
MAIRLGYQIKKDLRSIPLAGTTQCDPQINHISNLYFIINFYEANGFLDL